MKYSEHVKRMMPRGGVAAERYRQYGIGCEVKKSHDDDEETVPVSPVRCAMELRSTDSQVGRQRKEDPSGGLTNGALTQWRWGYWIARGSWEVLLGS